MQITENPISVLTNAPSFSWQMNNLRNYLNLSPVNAPNKTFNGVPITPTGQGSGFIGLPGDWTPPSRFVKMALLSQSVIQAADPLGNVNLAFHLLNTVDIPYGVVQTPVIDILPEYTQWAVVKDLNNIILYFRSYDYQNIQALALADLVSEVSAEPNGIKKFKMTDLSVIAAVSKNRTRNYTSQRPGAIGTRLRVAPPLVRPANLKEVSYPN